jgi:hypothetical protein
MIHATGCHVLFIYLSYLYQGCTSSVPLSVPILPVPDLYLAYTQLRSPIVQYQIYTWFVSKVQLLVCTLITKCSVHDLYLVCS